MTRSATRTGSPLDAIRAAIPLPIEHVAGTIDDLQHGIDPEELRLVDRAVEKRRKQFEAGRSAGRAALSALGITPRALLSGRLGEPLWPEGVVGSITHTAGWAGAAVARVEHVRGLGIDFEPEEDLVEEVWRSVIGRHEVARLRHYAPAERLGVWAKAVFSAKEAIYKCISPLGHEFFGFDVVDVHVTPDLSGFAARPLASFGGSDLLADGKGHISLSHGIIATAFVLPADPEAP